MVNKKAGTFTLAFGLIATGLVLFAGNFMEFPIRDLYKYWPVLFIFLGIEILFFMLFNKNKEEKISVDGLAIVFIVAIAVLSSGYAGYKSLSIKGLGDVPFISDLAQPYELKENIVKNELSKSYDIKGLKVTNSFGDIEIKDGEDGHIRLEAKVHVNYSNEDKAKRYIKEAVQVIEGEITEVYIKEVPQNEKSDYRKAAADFVIYIPKDIEVEVKNSFGDIDIDGSGKTLIKNSNGEISIKSCSRDVNVKSSFGDITMEEVQGSIIAVNSNGAIKAKAVGGKADFKTSFGDIKIDGGKDDIKAVTTNGEITIKNSPGNIEGKTSFGDIKLDAVSVENGEIKAETSFGEIRGFDSLGLKSSGPSNIVEGKLGRGSRRIDLKTNNGDIEIK